MARKSNDSACQEDIEVMATLLVAFPQMSRIVFDPRNRTLTSVFLCQGPLSKNKQRQLNKLYRESLEVYHGLIGIEPRIVNSSWELMDNLCSFQVERDVESLSTDELSLTASLVSQNVRVFSASDGSTLVEDIELSWSARFFLQELLEDIRNIKCTRQLVAVREGEKVIVFDK
ncbi:MAG TPA: hypothetical protein GYA09_02285 [Firmicutes bacterium]|nr:hypothetical protein [Candidatus Fermentithermobacillaceae bacterium]